jgi:hypothetical protein
MAVGDEFQALIVRPSRGVAAKAAGPEIAASTEPTNVTFSPRMHAPNMLEF